MFHVIDKSKMSAAGIVPLNTEQVFSMHALLNPNIHLVTLLGKAGSGKTLLAIATALEQLRQGIYKKIIIAAAMVPLSDKSIGALPGGIDAKVSPYMQGFFDNLDLIRNELKGKWDKEPEAVNATKKRKKTEKPASSKRKNAGKAAQQRQQVVAQSEEGPKDFITQQLALGNIQIQALATIRGRSLNNVKFILDESQNTTLHEAKTILTRAGKNTQMVFCGDIEQIDTPYLDERSNGMSNVIDKMSGHNIVAHVTLEKGERSELAELAAIRLKS
jgi:PhoH-like ATPase